MIVLDTNVLSELIRPEPDERVTRDAEPAQLSAEQVQATALRFAAASAASRS